jgi:hypothetical protein
MPKSTKLRATIAILFGAIAIFLCGWIYSRGGFSFKPLTFPIRLQQDSSVTVSFSVSERGRHEIEIQYPKDASDNLSKEFNALAGTVTLSSRGTIMTRTELRGTHQRWDSDSAAIVLLAFESEPGRQYVVSLQTVRVPPNLNNAPAIIRIELDPTQYKVFIFSFVFAILSFLIAVVCAILLIHATLSKRTRQK